MDPDDSICLHCLGCNSIFFVEMLNPPEDDDTPNPMFCPFCGRDHQTLEEEFDRMLVESLKPNLVLIPGGKK